jgi:hypothetical protein
MPPPLLPAFCTVTNQHVHIHTHNHNYERPDEEVNTHDGRRQTNCSIAKLYTHADVASTWSCAGRASAAGVVVAQVNLMLPLEDVILVAVV